MGQVRKDRRKGRNGRGGRRYVHSHQIRYSVTNAILDVVLIELPTQRPESYAFSVPLTSIYSLIVHPPTLSSWCE